MPEEEVEQRVEGEEKPAPEVKPQTPPAAARRGRRYFTRRNAGISAGVLAVLLVLLTILSVVFYRYGVFDNYVKAQFTAKMGRIGVVFDADVFRVTVSPLALELKNATFNDRVSGDKLFFIRDAHLAMTVQDLYAWQLNRDITINSTDVNGAEVWVKFDENGRSNFANLNLVEEEGQRVNFLYESVKFSLKDAVVHFGDVSHNITADANNVQFFLDPEDLSVPDEQKRYKLDFTSTDSRFVYDEHPLENIDIRARGIADRQGADITELRLETPIGVSSFSGRLSDWKSLKYDLDVESTVDLAQTSNTFPLGTPIQGVGNFKGHVTGEGENYRVQGTADTESLTAEGVYLKGLNIEGTVEGTNSSYDANGTAIAQLLTFEDFRVEFPKLTGNVRGTGTDFRWVGELQAAAAKSKSLTIGGLFLSDAVAEIKDRELTTTAGSGRAQRFSVAEAEFANLSGNGLKFSRVGETNDLTIKSGRVGSLKTKDYQMQNLAGRNVRVKDQGTRTDVDIEGVTATSGSIKNANLRNVKVDKFSLTDVPAYTDITAKNLRAEQADLNGTHVTGLEAPNLTVHNTSGEAIVYSDQTRIARIDTGSATLGSLNIAGVRLTIRRGTVQGSSNDIDAGNIALSKTKSLPEGGNLENVKLAKPVFVLEPAGRYRASADMSLGGGVIGSIPLGAARASLDINNDRVELNDLNANVMQGQVLGRAVIALNSRSRSDVSASFTDLDLSKLLALQGGRVIPLEGKASGNVNLNFAGTNMATASGTANANIAANAGNAERGFVPVNGTVALTANNGLFNVDQARFNTTNSQLNASGQFDLRDKNSNLDIALNSTDASEVDRLVRLLNVSPDLEHQLNSLQAQIAGNLTFKGKLTGNASDPVIDGRASVDSVSLHGREIGSVATDVLVSQAGVEVRNGMLRESAGGTIAFSASIPKGGANNTSIQATLTNVNAGDLLAALPINLPERLRDFTGQTSGSVNLTGLPNNANGEVNLSSAAGTLAGQAFDSLNVKAVFSGTRIDIQNGVMRLGQGELAARGTYDYGSGVFDLSLDGKSVPLPLVASLLPQNANIPAFNGIADFTATAAGDTDVASSYNINFNGSAHDVVINENAFGTVTFKGTTANQVLNAEVTTNLEGRQQVVNASVNFGDENLPFRLEHRLDRSPLRPFFALIPQLRNISIGGTGTGTIEFGGNLAKRGPDGTVSFTSENLVGTARFTQLDLLIQDTPLNATEPVVVRFSPQEITIESARFSGGGSNVVIAGTKALTEDGINNLSVDGRVNLNLLNAFPVIASGDVFFSGYADVAVRIAGVNRTARLSGSATLANASIAAFVGTDRLTMDRLTGRILFSSDQAQIEDLAGYLGGGKFTASGGALFGENLEIASYRVAIVGTNVTVPFPADFITTGDAELEISGRRTTRGDLATLVSGRIVARRSLYTKDIELANIVGARHDASLSSGSSSMRAPRFDLTIEGRDALVVRNNIADLTASVSLRVTGTTDNPQVSGRIVANSGTVFFRHDRYIVQRGVLDFPPGTAIEPVINLQAETEIAGYQIFVNLSGPLTDTAELNASVRSSPALPQADVISLVTTGNLSNNESGIPTLAQSGITTAAEVLADSIINEPARKATSKLFGLNVFEIDPIISGERLNASARLTVGRQINNNLRITYSTNLSQDQNQIVALEYRVSNKLSFIAQYEQHPLSNVTRNRDNFSVEIRFRRRF